MSTMATRIAPFKHVIWDWNGTLLNDGWLCVDIINGLLRERSLPTITFEQYQELFGFPIRDYYVRLGLTFERESFEALAQQYVSIYYRRVGECELHEGARALLEAMQCQQIGQSLLSAAHDENLRAMVAHFRVGGYFHRMAGLDDHYAASKTNLGKQLIRELTVSPEEILFVGDTLHDFEVASVLGTRCVLMAHGHHAKGRLEQCGSPVLTSFAELYEEIVSNTGV